MRRLILTLLLALGPIAGAGAQVGYQVWTCEVGAEVPGRFGTSMQRFQMRIGGDATVSGQGVDIGGGITEPMQFQGRWTQTGASFTVQGQMTTQMLGVRPFFFQSAMVSDREMRLDTRPAPNQRYISTCQRVQ